MMDGTRVASPNRVDTPPPGIQKDVKSNEHLVEKYVALCGGDKVISKVLVANNGIAAVKGIRSVRAWAYKVLGNERAIQFVVMATPEDLKANAEYIRMADHFEEVPGGPNNNNYANVRLIVEIAERTGVQAVWAGWGHASENPALPSALAKTNIAFIGPPAKAMRDLGDKIASTIIAQSADVSIVPWSGDDIIIDYEKDGLPDEIFQKACVNTVQEAKEVIARIGLPAMIKASEGGGGKGIRKVTTMEEIESSFRLVKSEVQGSPIFIMKMVSNCHHLEVQVLADKYGNAMSLYGRDCSVQRRHQKILEEGPATIAPQKMLRQMERAAVRLAQAVNYVSAGTVEYLYNDGYFFLELNPRLQVEHPCTEQITGVNLPAAQIQVAMGIPLHRIPCIRRLYGLESFGNTKIDFLKDEQKPPNGHVIAARITAENPEQGFKPTNGCITELTFRSLPNVWGYFSVASLGSLHDFADSQFGHLFSWGEDREEARKMLVLALKELSIRGDIRTPVEYLVNLIETDDFIHNKFHTGWLDGLISNVSSFADKGLNHLVVVVCGAIYKTFAVSKQRTDQFISILSRGQVPPTELLQTVDEVELIFSKTKYSVAVSQCGANSFMVSIGNGSALVECRPLADGGLLTVVDGSSKVLYGKEEAAGLRLNINGKTYCFTKEYDPTTLRALTPGKLVRYLVEHGSKLKKGTAYAEVEVMKMFTELPCPEDGTISFMKVEGSILSAGDVVATLELDDPSSVEKAVPFEGDLAGFKAPRARKHKLHQQLKHHIDIMQSIITGYNATDVAEMVNKLMEILKNSNLPLLEFQDIMSSLTGRIPKELEQQIQSVLKTYETGLVTLPSLRFQGSAILDLIDQQEEKIVSPLEQKEFRQKVEPIIELATKYIEGNKSHAKTVISSFLQEYVDVEKLFQGKQIDNAMLALRQKYKDDLYKVREISLSQAHHDKKSELIVLLLDTIPSSLIGDYVAILHELSSLAGSENIEVSLKARQLLMKYQQPSFKQRAAAIEDAILGVLNSKSAEDREIKLNRLINQDSLVLDALIFFLSHSNPKVREIALEIYCKRTYQAYKIRSIQASHKSENEILNIHFTFNLFDAVQMLSPKMLRNTAFANNSSADTTLANSDETSNSNSLANSLSSSLKKVSRSKEGDSGMSAVESVDDLVSFGEENTRTGMMVVFRDIPQMAKNFDFVLSEFNPSTTFFSNEPINVLNIFFLAHSKLKHSEASLTDRLQKFFSNYSEQLNKLGIRRVTVVVASKDKFPKYYTFRHRLDFGEDEIYRHVEPPLAYHMELRRLSNYDITYLPTVNRQIHLFFAAEKGKAETDVSRSKCFFVRAMVRCGGTFSDRGTRDRDYVISSVERVFAEGVKALESYVGDKRFAKAQNHHIFLKILNEIEFDLDGLANILSKLGSKYGIRLWRLRVGELELVGKVRRGNSLANLRFIVQNPTGFQFQVHGYIEVKDNKTGATYLTSIGGLGGLSSGPLDQKLIGSPYPTISLLQKKRHAAQNIHTTYIYDFPTLFRCALKEVWSNYAKNLCNNAKAIPKPRVVIKTVELILNKEGTQLIEVEREPGLNDIGMVAWKMTLFTPESPSGRDIIVIGNDITFQMGSFGPSEDILFYEASKLARKLKIPRIYIAANSGARIGLAREVKSSFKVAWSDPNDPNKGHKYLYLDDEDYQKYKDFVKAKKMDDRWIITDIIGQEHGIGVENLRGSGMIAGETSRAYEDIFTITLATGRTVGIGAYLVRLGQRTIQNEAPVILTGAVAINKLLGRDVYSSNVQLGGPQIMFNNGVSHIDVHDDLKGVYALINWLGYVPRVAGESLPILDIGDPADRDIEWSPQPTPYDPRDMLDGFVTTEGKWVSGMFDKGSFTETLAGWAKSVVCGRARLGGIPIGVIAVETRAIEHIIPADPANLDSQEVVVQKAGQVWFPDSAYKTAQAIFDFNKGEELPLMILANWRGFSGGMRDMFDEILKFGSYIVDALRVYKQPVFIYIPPHGELRGGAWVVLDPTINPEMMEMYSDVQGRGGVLEPRGTVEIKYRKKDLLVTMHRLDPILIEKTKALKNVSSASERDAIAKEIQNRETKLLFLYQQVATSFAELHDTPGRMKAKGVIKDVIEWTKARHYFYKRLRRRLAEAKVCKQIEVTHPGLSFSDKMDTIKSWVASTKEVDWNSDAVVADWLEANNDLIKANLAQLRKQFIASKVLELFNEDAQTVSDVIRAARKGK